MKFFNWILHLLFWSIPLLYILFISDGFVIGVFSKDDGSIYLPLFYGTTLNILLFYLNSYCLVPRLFKPGSYVRWGLYSILLFLGITLLESAIDSCMANHYYPTEDFEFWVNIFSGNAFIHIIIMGLSLASSFFRFLLKEEKKKQQLKQEQLKSELEMLRAQINPHFLFNTLNNLFASSRKNKDYETAEGIAFLSDMMRFMLYESNTDRIPIEKEATYIDQYIYLQKMRFHKEDDIEICFIKEGDLERKHIPPFLLIPFVENAFKHGIHPQKHSKIIIKLSIHNNYLHFFIENTRHGKSLRNSDGGIGIANVQRRLDLIFGNAGYSLNITDDKQETYKVNLHIEFASPMNTIIKTKTI